MRHLQHEVVLLSGLRALTKFLLVLLLDLLDQVAIAGSSSQILLVICLKFLLPSEVFLLLVLETFLDKVETVSNDDYKCVSGVDLVECVHEEGVGGVIQNEEEHDSRFVFALRAVDQGNWAVLHLACT